MKRVLFLLPLLLLTGCSSQSQRPYAVDPMPTEAPSKVKTTSKVKPTLQPDQVDTARLQPAQGHLAPGVLVYTKDGFMWGRVIKVEPDHVFPKGERGGVLFSDQDNSKEAPSYWPFKEFDKLRVLKN